MTNNTEENTKKKFPRCQVILESTGKQCKKDATFNGVVCSLHADYNKGDLVKSTQTLKKQHKKEINKKISSMIEEFPEYKKISDKLINIKDKVEKMQKNPDLNNLDTPISYLHHLRNRIESDENLTELQRFDILNKNIKSTYECLEKRANIILRLKYSITIDQFKIFVKKVINSIDYVIEDSDLRKSIKQEIIKNYKESLPSDDIN